jgi:hypothetical protein
VDPTQASYNPATEEFTLLTGTNNLQNFYVVNVKVSLRHSAGSTGSITSLAWAVNFASFTNVLTLSPAVYQTFAPSKFNFVQTNFVWIEINDPTTLASFTWQLQNFSTTKDLTFSTVLLTIAPGLTT